MSTLQSSPLKSQNDTIKAHLLAGKHISTWQAYKQYNITCLAQRIHDLRNAGLSIKSKIVVRDGKRFSNYWLDSDVLQSYQQNLNDGIVESIKSEALHDVK